MDTISRINTPLLVDVLFVAIVANFWAKFAAINTPFLHMNRCVALQARRETKLPPEADAIFMSCATSLPERAYQSTSPKSSKTTILA